MGDQGTHATSEPRNKHNNRSSIAHLEKIRQEYGNSSSTTRQRQSLAKDANAPSPHRGSEDYWRPQVNDDEQDDIQAVNESKEAMEARKHLAMSNAQEKEKNKENLDEGKNGHTKLAKPRAFVDRQDTAERVSWDESQESTSQVQAAHTGKKPTRSVRQAEDEEQIPDPSEDEGFQSNTGVVDVRKRGGAAPTAHRKNTVPAKRRPSIEPPPPQREKSQGDVDENDVVELYSRSAPSRSQADIAAEQKNANLLAKFQVRTRAPAKAQTRRPWTEDETSTLIENIVEHGTSYTLIKTLDDARDQVLQGRDQGALKDKARNIKTDYLKAGIELPRNFDKIPLNKALKDKLSAIGIVYNDLTGLAE